MTIYALLFKVFNYIHILSFCIPLLLHSFCIPLLCYSLYVKLLQEQSCEHYDLEYNTFHVLHLLPLIENIINLQQRVRLLKRYMKGISDNVLREKAKREQNLVAQLHLKNTQLCSTFRLWRGRVRLVFPASCSFVLHDYQT